MITNALLHIPPLALFVLVSLVGAILGGLGTFLFRKFIKVKILRSHNEVTGFLFLSIASFYAFLLSFVVFLVWGQWNEIRSNVSKEGSSAMGLYRDIKFYPDTVEAKQLMVVYLDFVYNVIDEEFPNMQQMKPSRKTTESFNNVFFKMEHLNPKNQFQIQLVAEMFNHLNELATYRGLRDTFFEKVIPPPLWWPILLGALITLFCAMLLDIEYSKMHIGLNTLLGIFIGMIIFIILLLNHPYSGALSIKPQSYKEIFNMEQWSNEQLLEDQDNVDQVLKQSDDAFDLLKKERMLSNDSGFVSDEIIAASLKTIQIKKVETPNEWTKFQRETEIKIKLNENSINQIKRSSHQNAALLKKVTKLEKVNADLRIKMDEYKEEVRQRWDTFKGSMNHQVNEIAIELKALNTNNNR